MCGYVIYGSPEFHESEQTVMMGGIIPDNIQDAPIDINKKQDTDFFPVFRAFINQQGNGEPGMFGPNPLGKESEIKYF